MTFLSDPHEDWKQDRIRQHRDRLLEEAANATRNRDMAAYYEELNRQHKWRMPLAVTATGAHLTEEGLVVEVADGNVKVPPELLKSIAALIEMWQLAKLASQAEP